MRRYRYLGVTLASEVALPGLPPTTEPVDVEVTFIRRSACPSVGPPWKMVDPPRTAWRARSTTGSRLRLQFNGYDGEWAEFLISERGDRVTITLGDDVDVAEAVQMLLGSVFSCVLAQRGTTCLHASVVVREGRSLALVGPKGSGKSTLALACIREGADLVSDDVAAISLDDGLIATAIGTPRLRLRTDTASALAGGDAELRPIWGPGEHRPQKVYYDVTGPSGSATFVPLDDVCLLAPRGSGLPAVRDLTPSELLPRLMAARHMSAFLDGDGHRRDFDCLAALAARVPGREVHRPDDLATASAVARAILDVRG